MTVPLPEAHVSSAPNDQPRSLFVNLSATDIGIGAESNSLYLVFKLLRDEPARETITGHAGPSHQQSNNQTNGVPSSTSRGSLKGRNSFLGSRRKKSHDRASS